MSQKRKQADVPEFAVAPIKMARLHAFGLQGWTPVRVPPELAGRLVSGRRPQKRRQRETMVAKRYADEVLPEILKLLDEHPELDNTEIAKRAGVTAATPWAPVGRTRTVLTAVKKLWSLTPR